MKHIGHILKKALFLAAITLGTGMAYSQALTVKGTVVDENDEPLIGVSIQVAGTTMGTITSDDGTFQVNVPVEKVTTLHMSYVGYLTQKIEVKPGENNIVVYMQEDAIMLEEAVVVGYGTQKKVNLTGAITTVGSEKLENRVKYLEKQLKKLGYEEVRTLDDQSV